MRVSIKFIILLFLSINAHAAPPAPSDSDHPGSKTYTHQFTVQAMKCLGRDVTVYAPKLQDAKKKVPVVVFGHGQALKLEHYTGTFEHIAKKGIAVVFPMYDKGFFDQDWTRMAGDYIAMSMCAIKSQPQLSVDQVVFSGHSKGAYVASIASGISARDQLSPTPGATVLFGLAGFDSETASVMSPSTAMTIVFSDREKVVSREFSEFLYRDSASRFKQFIDLKSYPADQNGEALLADHFWPQTKSAIFGGRSENALHYFGSWKWLVAAAEDLVNGNRVTHPYLYGEMAGDKGVAGLQDEIKRNW